MDLRYPIGPFEWSEPVDPAGRAERIRRIAETPALLRSAIQGLDDAQLDTPYRDGGWTVRQVIHHVPDSHMNAYVRFRMTLTEDSPVIKPYAEAKWAELFDARQGPVEESLALLEQMHKRWVRLLQNLADADFARSYVHPQMPAPVTLEAAVAAYAWHGRHHAAHITGLRERMGW